jgi:hypothetical protein
MRGTVGLVITVVVIVVVVILVLQFIEKTLGIRAGVLA